MLSRVLLITGSLTKEKRDGMPNCSCRLGRTPGTDSLRLFVDRLVRTCISDQRVADLGIRVHAVYDARLSGGYVEQQSHVVWWLAGASCCSHCRRRWSLGWWSYLSSKMTRQ